MKTWEDFKKKNPLDNESQLQIDLVVKIVTTRENKGITQKELAEKVGMSQPQLAKIETFQTEPKIGTLLRLFDGLGLTLVIREKTTA
ncbi:DNA-binding helix-turn-helix protein [Enterococcus faecalis ATCC 29200]|uniref:helix-turn-helix domain-containing protein n=1 Tax=Enterococcus faecalis TaxID=1351 RepID=UPI00019F6B47|nr:helix-turn-helix transcriptional regulator [Enterococcus faecalis]EEN70397.1 DNA-binding helix-turn-helix protein [Enterococcus faecalis ATCC 29200]EOJ05959.1 hypothetical protein UMK_02816 [Enterococcus faecalis ATCC 29200]HDT7989495.1 helix-turn-helix transcriptional regulator [Enterococcus faecalis]HDT8070275.1 helix-turn-helix transcriptional regulator [Enterococcus faecalis]